MLHPSVSFQIAKPQPILSALESIHAQGILILLNCKEASWSDLEKLYEDSQKCKLVNSSFVFNSRGRLQ